MSDSLIGDVNRNDKWGNKRGKDFCTVCGEPLAAGTTFCPHCGPPVSPEEELEEGLGMGQTLFRVLLILILFGAIIVFKLDLNLNFGSKGEEPSPEASFQQSSENPPGPNAHTVDYKTINSIRGEKVEVREKPEANGKVVEVLKQGASVKVLDGNEDWWQISAEGKTGWILKENLDTEIR